MKKLALLLAATLAAVPLRAQTPNQVREQRLQQEISVLQQNQNWRREANIRQQAVNYSRNDVGLFDEEGRLLSVVHRGRERHTKDSIVAANHQPVFMHRGIKEEYEHGITLTGGFLSTFQDIFEWNKLPRSLASILITESALNPHALSRARAEGIAQILRAHVPSIRRFARIFGDSSNYTNYDMFTEVGYATAMLKLGQKQYNSTLLSTSAYNAGRGNLDIALHAGERVSHEENSLLVYWIGAELAAQANRHLPRRARKFSPEARDYTESVVGHKPNYDDLVNRLNRMEVYRYRTDQSVSLRSLSELYGVPLDTLRLLNPHANARRQPRDIIPARSFFYLDSQLFVKPEETFWRNSTPELDEVWRRFEEWQPERWDQSIVPTLNQFADDFAKNHQVFMAVACAYFGHPVSSERYVERHLSMRAWQRVFQATLE